jgi:integrase
MNVTRKRRGRGEGSIFQRDDGLWCAILDLGRDAKGKRRRKSVYAETTKEAQEKLLKLQQDAGAFDVSTMKLRHCLDFWLSGVKAHVSTSTYERYRFDVEKYLIPHLGMLQLNHLTASHVAQLFVDMRRAGASADAQRKAGTVLRQALKQAMQFDLIPTNPALKVKLPRVTREEIAPLDPAGVARLFAAAAGDRLYALFVLAIDSGMREGELFALTWDDLNEERCEIAVTKSLEDVRGQLRVKEPKTAKARRRIRLAPSTLAELLNHRERVLAEGHGSNLVFPTTNGGFLRRSNVYNRVFQPIVKRAGLDGVRFHDLRHTCATLLLLRGVNVKVVSERLGHAKIQITLDTYSHVLPTMQEEAPGVMESILNPTPVQSAQAS